MPDKANRPGNRLMDRPEYRLKQQPLTCLANTSVFDAVLAMSEKNFGAIVVIDKLKKVIGVFTERDVMNKVVGKELNTHKTLVKDIMTPNPRVANETDNLIDWLRIMSNEQSHWWALAAMFGFSNQGIASVRLLRLYFW